MITGMNLEQYKLSNIPRAIKFYKDDDEALIRLHKSVRGIVKIDLTDLIRDCVREGRPVIEARFKSLTKESNEHTQR
jgi:hypothetical protein